MRWCLVALAISVLLAACAGSPDRDSGSNGGSRYEESQDGPPRGRPSGTGEEPTPNAEPLSRYGNHSPYTVRGKTYRVLPSSQGYRKTGTASWYGRKFHGHKTSSGEIYDMFQFSAANRELPLPSFVEVTNLDNGRSVIVRVNDRGPFHGDRLIDLSFAAAEKLDMVSSGTARVEVRAINALAAGPMDGKVWLQVGAYSEREFADDVRRKLRANAIQEVTVSRVRSNRRLLWRVRVGPFTNENSIRNAADKIQSLGLGESVRVGDAG